MIEQLKSIRLNNSSVVTKDMRFHYASRPCHYMEDVDQWATRYNNSYYNYLYMEQNGESVAPPAGMRSSVPLGGMGAGTIELRADGSLRDWTIFNNSPASGSKVQLEEAGFYLWMKEEGRPPVFKALKTHDPNRAPVVSQIEYAATYPVSRLVFSDEELRINISLYAFCEIQLYDADHSAAPSVHFSFVLENLREDQVEVSILFVLPNHIEGTFRQEKNTLYLSKEGELPHSGEMAVNAESETLKVTGVAGESIFGLLREFAVFGEFPQWMQSAQKENPVDGAVGRVFDQPKRKRFGSLASKTILHPNETTSITFTLGWYFPFRPHAGEILGNYYTNLYQNVSDVVNQSVSRIPRTLQHIQNWHSLCMDNTMPEWLQDAMVNSIATISKTGTWFHDGRWRQWESFSCPAVDPIHIHLYRVLPYAWFFNDLRRSQMRGYIQCQSDDGYIQENLGRATNKLDTPLGRQMGDGCTAFILGAYQDYLWSGDRAFFDEIWPAVRKATAWQMERAGRWSLPHHLNNTYDLWEMNEKDLSSYNAFLHLAGLRAAQEMSTLAEDVEFASACEEAFSRGQKALRELLWNGEYYVCWKNINDEMEPSGIMTDTLYGQLWANMLGLGMLEDPNNLRQHLLQEQQRNDTPYGLKVIGIEGRESDALTGILHDPNKYPINDTVWEAGTLDWCALHIELGGDVEEGLQEAEKIYRKWREQLRDQWDIRDLSAAWNGEPYCNSHYSRQLILWAIPLALSGQQYNAIAGKLYFKPKLNGPYKLPFMTPQACGTLELKQDQRFELNVLTGTLNVNEIYLNDILVFRQCVLQEGQSMEQSVKTDHPSPLIDTRN